MLTLDNQRKLGNDMLIKGIIDSVVTVNQFYMMLPFKGISGNALAYNRETVSDSTTNTDQSLLVTTGNTLLGQSGQTAINKDSQKFTRHSTELTTIIGDAQINGLIQAIGSDYNDATALQVAAKAKGLGRSYMNLLINGSKDSAQFTAVATGGTETAANFAIFANLAASDITLSATATTANVAAAGLTATNRNVTYLSPFITGGKYTDSGAALTNAVARFGAYQGTNTNAQIASGWSGFDGLETFALVSQNNVTPSSTNASTSAGRLDFLDQLIDRVHDKDGMVDYIMLNSAGVRKITQAFRVAGTGFDMMDVKSSSGSVMSVQSYRGVPILRNDFIGDTGVSIESSFIDGGDSSSAAASAVFVGTLDDGSLSHGICGLTASKSAGMQVQKLGAMEDVDADITRVKWYCGLAHFSELGLVKGFMV